MGSVWDRQALRWAAAVAWMGLIFYLSAQSTLPSLAPFVPGLQAIAGHVGAYAVLAVLLQGALAGAGVQRAGWWAIVLAALYGMSDEFHQSFVPGRDPDVFDLAMDTVGASAALLARWLWIRLKQGREEARARLRAPR